MLSSTQQSQVMENMGLAHYIALEFHSNHQFLDMDDLVSDAACALVKATDTFDESRGVKFVDYAARVIRNRLIDVCRNASNEYAYCFSSVLARDQQGEIMDEYGGLDLCCEEEGFAEVEHIEFTIYFHTTLSQEERIIFAGRKKGLTQTAIAHELTNKLGKRYDQKKVCFLLKDLHAKYQQCAMTY